MTFIIAFSLIVNDLMRGVFVFLFYTRPIILTNHETCPVTHNKNLKYYRISTKFNYTFFFQYPF